MIDMPVSHREEIDVLCQIAFIFNEGYIILYCF
jgi:hypothetical protein